jgi:small subunit ribosomal protein S2
MEEEGLLEKLSKKEKSRLMKEKMRLERGLSGIKEMESIPGIMFVVDLDLESLAVAEARKLGIPIVALVDTNCDPELVDYVIPGNDDAIRSIKLVSTIICDAVLEGVAMRAGTPAEIAETEDKTLSKEEAVSEVAETVVAEEKIEEIIEEATEETEKE